MDGWKRHLQPTLCQGCNMPFWTAVVYQHKNSRSGICQYLVQICESPVTGYVIAMTSMSFRCRQATMEANKRKLLMQMRSHTATVCIHAHGQNTALKRQFYGPSTDARQFADTPTTPCSPSYLPIKTALQRRCQWQVHWQAPRIGQLLGPEFMRAVHSPAQLPAAKVSPNLAKEPRAPSPCDSACTP